MVWADSGSPFMAGRNCMAAGFVEVLFLVNCITAYSFNYGHMQFGGPSNPSSIIRQRCFLELVRSSLRDSLSGGQTPAFRVNSRKVFNQVINNNDFKWTEIRGNIDSEFSVQNKQIFHVDYKDRDEIDFADQIVKHCIFPILRNARVNCKLHTILKYLLIYF